MLQPVRVKRPPPPPLVRKQPPPSSSSSSSINNLDFSIKTLDQIRAEKKKKQQRADGDDADRREGEVAGTEDEQTNRTTTTLLPIAQAGDTLKEEREVEGEGESDSGMELPKMVAPQKRKRKVVIKRSTLHKNADSALLSTAESAKSSDRETSDLAPSPKKKRTTDEISTSESQTLEPCFDATCIDRSVPLPDNHQEQRESKLTLHRADTRATFDDYATLYFKNTAQRKKINLQQPSRHQSRP
jgi:hypothetical protein